MPSGYHFRRRVPSHLRDVLGKREVWHSLGTTKRDMAKAYACEVYVSTEKLFISATRLMDELKETEDFIKNELSDEMREVFEFLIKDYQDQIKILKTKYKQQELRHALDSLKDAKELERAKNIAERGAELLNKTIKYVKPEKSLLADIQSQINDMKAYLKPPEAKPSPLFSEAVETFLSTKTKAKSTVINSYRETFKRFIEVCEDKPLREYSGEDAGLFKSLMEQLPETYGKQRNDTRTIQEFVDYANKKKLPRVSGKSVKNHFTRLSGFFKYFLLREQVDRNIFTGGWQFDNKPKNKRVRWNDEDLKRITGQSWQFGTISHKTASMIVGIASYTGMRLDAHFSHLRQFRVIL
ncbi:DUF6538 domain-containing protein [Acetobacter cerevisiae]|uniref:DUF6538 domain-containing protein n=1 Tax=Acetobacter cerevisiae TaxID=178900 RepID=UPI003417F3EE